MKFDDKHIMYFRSMGKLLRITAIFTDVEKCNNHCATCNDGVIAEAGQYIFCADMGDKGHEKLEADMLSLIDGVVEIVELYQPETPAQSKWKTNWLSKARKALAQ
jgi:hypothetical protein